MSSLDTLAFLQVRTIHPIVRTHSEQVLVDALESAFRQILELEESTSELGDEVETLKGRIGELDGQNEDLDEEWKDAEERCEKLAAENVKLTLENEVLRQSLAAKEKKTRKKKV